MLSKQLLKKFLLIKSLVVYANHALLDFYLCQFRIHKYDIFNNS